MPVPLVTDRMDKHALEACVTKAQSKLQEYRDAGNELMEATTEADINLMLEELQRIYRRGKRTHDDDS